MRAETHCHKRKTSLQKIRIDSPNSSNTTFAILFSQGNLKEIPFSNYQNHSDNESRNPLPPTLHLYLIQPGYLERRKEGGSVLFNDALNTFYLRSYGVKHMVKDHSDSEIGNPLPPHRLFFPISNKGTFICTIPQTG